MAMDLTGFIAKSLISFSSQAASLEAAESPMYCASDEERVTQDCLLKSQVIGTLPNLKTNLVVDLAFSLSPAKSASTNHVTQRLLSLG
jgi:hypothetical protein